MEKNWIIEDNNWQNCEYYNPFGGCTNSYIISRFCRKRRCCLIKTEDESVEGVDDIAEGR